MRREYPAWLDSPPADRRKDWTGQKELPRAPGWYGGKAQCLIPPMHMGAETWEVAEPVDGVRATQESPLPAPAAKDRGHGCLAVAAAAGLHPASKTLPRFTASLGRVHPGRACCSLHMAGGQPCPWLKPSSMWPRSLDQACLACALSERPILCYWRVPTGDAQGWERMALDATALWPAWALTILPLFRGREMAAWWVLLGLLAACVTEAAKQDMLNVCMDAKHHKTKPGPEGQLHNQVRGLSSPTLGVSGHGKPQVPGSGSVDSCHSL